LRSVAERIKRDKSERKKKRHTQTLDEGRGRRQTEGALALVIYPVLKTPSLVLKVQYLYNNQY
jgi:hypothetical protein